MSLSSIHFSQVSVQNPAPAVLARVRKAEKVRAEAPAIAKKKAEDDLRHKRVLMRVKIRMAHEERSLKMPSSKQLEAETDFAMSVQAISDEAARGKANVRKIGNVIVADFGKRMDALKSRL